MQRKNCLLRTPKNKKSGFAMIMAMAVIVVLATIMAISLAMTSKTAKSTADLYIYEQAILLSKSATEYALLRISQAAPCVETSLNFTKDPFNDDDDNGIFDINISMRYIYTDLTTCTATGGTNYFTTPITTEESNGSVLMDVTVTVDDDTIVSEPIRYFRRSIQKL